MSEIKHTPGPWHWVDSQTDEPYRFEGSTYGPLSLRTVEEFGVNETKVIDGQSYTSFALPMFIMTIEDCSFENPNDARLIAAAPELLAALKEVRLFVAGEALPTKEQALQRIDSVIAKVEGNGDE